MPFNGSGVYTPPGADFPVVTNTVISSTHFNNTINDIATGLTNCLTKDGQSTPIANIKLGGFKLTGVGAPSTTNDALTFGTAGTMTTLTASVVGSSSGNFTLNSNSTNRWSLIDASAGSLVPSTDNVTSVGSPSNRVASIFTPIIDSGTAGSLSLKTSNGTTQFEIAHTASAVNWLQVSGRVTTAPPSLSSVGSDTNIGMLLSTKGTGSFDFYSNTTGSQQFQILHTASANRNITVTGSNGGNPTISTTAGNLAITSNVVLSGILQAGATPGQGGQINVPYGGLISSRNQSGGADITLISSATINGVTNTLAIGAGTSTGVLLDARSGAGAPTTSDLGASRWMLWRDTSGATTKLYYNNAGTLQSVALV